MADDTVPRPDIFKAMRIRPRYARHVDMITKCRRERFGNVGHSAAQAQNESTSVIGTAVSREGLEH